MLFNSKSYDLTLEIPIESIKISGLFLFFLINKTFEETYCINLIYDETIQIYNDLNKLQFLKEDLDDNSSDDSSVISEETKIMIN